MKNFWVVVALILISTSPAYAGKWSTGTTAPAICTVGDSWTDTNGTPDNRFYTCTSTNTWTLNSNQTAIDAKADKLQAVRYWADHPNGTQIAAKTIVAYDGKLYTTLQAFDKVSSSATPDVLTAYFEPIAGATYTLPAATANTLGGVKVGGRLTVTADGVLSADVQTTDISGKEDSLGNPSVNGYVLSSTTAGARSWVEMTGGGTGIAHATSDGNYYASRNGAWANLAGVFVATETDPSFSAWDKDYADLINTPAIPAALADLGDDATHRIVTDAEKSAWNAKLGALPTWLPSTGPTADNQIIQATGAGTSGWTSVVDGLINDAGTGTDDLLSASEIAIRIAAAAALKQDALGYTPENAANKGVANGYASLGVDGLVPASQLPAAAGTDDQTAAEVGVSVTNFGGNLSSADDTVQKALETLDNATLSGGSSTVILQQSFVSSSVVVADTGAKNKLATGIGWGIAEIGCDASDTLAVSVKTSATVNGTYTEIGTVSLTGASAVSGVDISSWANSIAGHWIRIDLTGSPAAAKDCVIAISGVEL